ncbi:zeta toxin family protein [Agreia sp. COWG]|uniref:zeta toxin family protein n=1 Tax=Agreia sp. COWG TaxID=2773266 RepID=UPI00192812AA|nr:zeta toxin family protein [Agreia sp. COWG]CAD6016141.1 Zeta_toxin domain-containing protein [Agreia sp. COWG]
MIRPNDYDLTPEQLQVIFDERIRRRLFRRARTEHTPSAVLLGAQSGSGKTKALQSIVAATPGDPVAIVGDDLRAFHPAYARLLEDAPTEMPDATAQASGAWVRMSIDYARDHKVSVVIEGTFRNPDVTILEAARFHEAGYRTHVVALAVPGAVSRLSTLDRFVADARVGRDARWTPLEGHQRGYEGTPRTVAAAEQSPHVDQLSIQNRNGQILYTGTRPTPAAHIDGAVDALELGRNTPQSPAAAADWLERFHGNITYAGAHGLVSPEHRALFAALTDDAHQVADQAYPQAASTPSIAAHHRIDQVDEQLRVYTLAARFQGTQSAEQRLRRVSTTVPEPHTPVIPDLATRMRGIVADTPAPTNNDTPTGPSVNRGPRI